MTMLDRMRRHKNWLKWSLVLVVLAFIALYIPASNNSATGAGLNDAVATVEGSDVTVAEFRQAYNRQMQAYRSAYGANMDERLLRQLGIDQRIVQQLIEEEIALVEAKRLGISASDEEVRARILAIPSFQENGQFIGYERYRQMLQVQNPPVRESDFEGIQPWRGLRPCSPDGLPYLGRSARIKNLVVATGHGMMGISLGPITGKLVSQLVCGEKPEIDLALLSPDRWGQSSLMRMRRFLVIDSR